MDQVQLLISLHNDDVILNTPNRNFELCQLQARHVTFGCQSPEPYRSSFIKVRLENRKGWQGKLASEGSLESMCHSL